MRCHRYLFILACLCALVGPCGAATVFPPEWGDPPVEQMGDYVRLPYGYGQGSSTLAGWIEVQVKFVGFPNDWVQSTGVYRPPSPRSMPVFEPLPPAGITSTQVDITPVKAAAQGNFARQAFGSKPVNLACTYKGKRYEANLFLGHRAAKEYLEKDDPISWREEERTSHLARVSDPRDYAVTQLAQAINRHAQENGLNDSEKAELATAFVQQGVNYGRVRPAYKINYPFTTLYDGAGVCGDKSVLLTALLKRLGYASGLFYYYPESNEPQDDPDNPHHMVSGILTDGKGSYGTRYAAIETTGNSEIGGPLEWPTPKELIVTSKGRPYRRN